MGFRNLIPIIGFSEHVMDSGHGSRLADASGKEYIDLNSGQFCTVLGHGNAEFQNRLAERIGTLVHTASDIVSEPVLECAEKMNHISGNMDARVISLSTGSEAVEFALRYGKHITGKQGVVCFDKGYHGLTLGSQSITFGGRFAQPPVQGIHPLPIPPDGADYATVASFLADAEQVFESGEIALAILEPVVSVGGMFYPPASYFQGMRRICDKHGALLVLDESQTGFGRLGSWFAYQRLGIVPDMVVLSKGVGCGYPVAFVMMAGCIVPDSGFVMMHYSSHQNDAFAGAVTGTAIDYIEEKGILAQVEHTGAYYLKRLRELEQANPHFINARGEGLMLGGEFHFEGVTNYRRIYHELRDYLMDRGVIIQGTNGGETFRSLPDYLISEADIDEALSIIGDSLEQRSWRDYE